MANVAFKRGLSTSLPTTAVDGVFYLTTDTNRLYVGNGTTMAELNRYIVTVNSTANLPTSPALGDFCYIKDENILAVCTSTTGSSKWTQVNPDTDTNIDTKVEDDSTKFEYEFVEGTDGNTLKLQLTIGQDKYDLTDTGSGGAAIANIVKTIEIPVDSIIANADLAVGLTVDGADGSMVLKNTGTGAANDSVTFKAGDNVELSRSGTVITINSDDTQYTLSGANDKIVLTDNESGAAGSITVSDDDVVIGSVANNTLSLSHKNYSPSNTESTEKDKTSIVAISGITTEKGHITGYKTVTYELPEDNDTTNADLAVSGGTITLTDSDGGQVSAKDALYFETKQTDANGDAIKVYNQGVLDFYTQAEVDAKLSAVDAMVYRGAVTSDTNLNNQAPFSVGDTFKVAVAGTYGGHECVVGDILIANGTEVDGVITSGLSWDYIPSGNDTRVTYNLKGDATNDRVYLVDYSDNTSGENQGYIDFEEGTGIDIATTVSGNNTTIQITHENVECGSTTTEKGKTVSEGTITVMGDVTVNSQGHVTQKTYYTYQLPEDNDTTYTVGVNDSASQGEIVLTAGGDGLDTGATDSVIIAAGNQMVVSGDSSTSKITVAHETIATSTASPSSSVGSGKSFTAVTGVETSNGHVSKVTTTTYTLPEDNDSTYTLSGATPSVATSNGVTTATLTTTLTGGGTANGSNTYSTTKVSSSSLQLTSQTNGYNIDFVWGSF